MVFILYQQEAYSSLYEVNWFIRKNLIYGYIYLTFGTQGVFVLDEPEDYSSLRKWSKDRSIRKMLFTLRFTWNSVHMMRIASIKRKDTLLSGKWSGLFKKSLFCGSNYFIFGERVTFCLDELENYSSLGNWTKYPTFR